MSWGNAAWGSFGATTTGGTPGEIDDVTAQEIIDAIVAEVKAGILALASKDATLPDWPTADWGTYDPATMSLEGADEAGTAAFDAIPTAAENASAVRTELTTELGRIDAAVSTRLASAGYTAPPSAATNATAVRTELTTELGRLDAAISTRLGSASYTAAPSAATVASQVRTELAVELGRIDASISSVSTGGVSAGDIATAVRTELTTELGRIDVAVSTRLATAGYTAAPTAAANATAVRTELATELARLDVDVSSVAPTSTAAYTGTIATASNGGTGGVGVATLNTPYPTFSLADFVVTVDGMSYEVASHTANQGAITLREAWKAIPSASDAITADYFPSLATARAATATAVVAAWAADVPPEEDLTGVELPTNRQIMAAMRAVAVGREDSDEEAGTYTRQHKSGVTMRSFTLTKDTSTGKIKGRT